MALFWKNIGQIITEDGSVDLMGCNLAQGDTGQNFIEELAAITHRNVAASTDSTGNGPNADWELEEGGVQLVGKYFDQQSIADYRGRFDAITLNGLEISDADGDGFYDIDSKEKLIALSQDRSGWDKNYELTTDITFDADHTQVDWNGDGVVDGDDAAGFLPIGTDRDHSFSGTFDGNGHSITNLYINRENVDYIGLFGCYAGASITDLSLNNVDITGNYSVGGLVGRVYQENSSSATIENIAVSGEVCGGGWWVGGLVGEVLLSGFGASCTIKNSYVSENVSGIKEVGNLIGRVFTFNNSSLSIEDSYASGGVSVRNWRVGGLIGIAYTHGNSSVTIKNSYASGEVSGRRDVGGLVGDVCTYDNSSLSIENSYASGEINGISRVGGMIGTAIAKAKGTINVQNHFHDKDSALGYESVSGNGQISVTPKITKQQTIEHLLGLRDAENNPIWTDYNGALNPVLSSFPNHAPTINAVTAPITYADRVADILANSTVDAKDGNGNTLGIAITATHNNGHGHWQYSVDDGATWQDIGNIPAGQAFFLQHTDRILFSPADGTASGTANFSFRAWDGSDGIADKLHQTVLLSGSYGGEAAYSSNEARAQVHFDPNHGMNWDGDNLIESAKELLYLSQNRELWAEDYTLTTDITFDADHTQVDWNGDGVVNGDDVAGFSPIGTDLRYHSFSGAFDGNGHSITNLYINRGNTDYIGLFGYYSGAAITNLSLNNIDITGNNRVGGLVGFADFEHFRNSSFTIENSSTSGDITGNNFVGGLVGFAEFDESPNSSFTIENSFTSGDITGNDDVGGLVGFTDFEDSDNSSFSIENAYSSGDISGDDDVGGLVGRVILEVSSFSIENSYTSGNIRGTATNAQAGGIIGDFSDWGGSSLTVDQSFHRINPAIGEGSAPVTVTNEELTKQAVIERLLALRDDANKPIWTEVDASGNLLDDPILSDGSNHAPTLVSGAAWDISSRIAQGIAVTELLEHFSAGDNDRDTLGAALAITANTGAGIFEYSTDDGNTWQTLNPGDAATSILLGAADRIRLVNNQGAAKTARFTLRAWDRSSGTLHDTVVIDENNSSGTTAFSAEIGNLDVAIAEEPSPPVDPPVDPPPNEAPILGITEHDASGMIEQGVSVVDILNMFEAEDPDGYDASLQMRITGIDAAHGIWQVKRAYYNTWQDLDITTSRFLNPQDMIRFVPEPGYKEQVSLSFVAIDADFDSSNSATLTATPENHRPEMEAQNHELGELLQSTTEQITDDVANTITVQQLFDIFAVTDTDDAIETLHLVVTSLDRAGGIWLYRNQGGNWQNVTKDMVLSGTAELTYNGTEQEDVASLSFKVVDFESSSTNTATITIPKPVVDDDTEPGDDDTEPGDDNTEPGDDNTEPGDDNTEPGDDNTEPGDDNTEPGDDNTEPGDDSNTEDSQHESEDENNGNNEVCFIDSLIIYNDNIGSSHVNDRDYLSNDLRTNYEIKEEDIIRNKDMIQKYSKYYDENKQEDSQNSIVAPGYALSKILMNLTEGYIKDTLKVKRIKKEIFSNLLDSLNDSSQILIDIYGKDAIPQEITTMIKEVKKIFIGKKGSYTRWLKFENLPKTQKIKVAFKGIANALTFVDSAVNIYGSSVKCVL